MSIQPLILLTPILLVKLCWKWLPDYAISHWYSLASWNIPGQTEVRPFRSSVGGQPRFAGCSWGCGQGFPKHHGLSFASGWEKAGNTRWPHCHQWLDLSWERKVQWQPRTAESSGKALLLLRLSWDCASPFLSQKCTVRSGCLTCCAWEGSPGKHCVAGVQLLMTADNSSLRTLHAGGACLTWS